MQESKFAVIVRRLLDNPGPSTRKIKNLMVERRLHDIEMTGMCKETSCDRPTLTKDAQRSTSALHEQQRQNPSSLLSGLSRETTRSRILRVTRIHDRAGKSGGGGC